LAESFDASWARADFKHKPLQRLRKSRSKSSVLGDSWSLLLSAPSRGPNLLKRSLISDLRSAREVQVICAYFLPSWRLRRELQRVVQRGGSVQLILAGKSDVRLSQLASHKLYRLLLRRGVEIYEYQPQILHAKLIVVDDIAYAGSSNLDARSLNINYELMVRISDPQVVREAREIFAAVLSHSRRIEFKEWSRSRNFWTKLMEEWAYFLLGRLDPYFAKARQKNVP
jgi:cardiolipin synthase